jgi:hypothetical protein
MFVLVIAAACRSPQQELVRNLQEVRSWAASSRMVAARWQRRTVPASYAVDAVDAAVDAVREELASLDAMSGIDAEDKRQARSAAERVRALCYDLRESVRYSDGAAAARFSAQLAGAETSLAAFASRVAGRAASER